MEEVEDSIDLGNLSKEELKDRIISLVLLVQKLTTQIQKKDKQIVELTKNSISGILGSNQEELELPIPTLKYRYRLNKKQKAKEFLLEHWVEWLEAKMLDQSTLKKHDVSLYYGVMNYCSYRGLSLAEIVPTSHAMKQKSRERLFALMYEVDNSIKSADLSKKQLEDIVASLDFLVQEQAALIYKKDEQIVELTKNSISTILGINQEEPELPIPTLKYKDRLDKTQNTEEFLLKYWGKWLEAGKLNQQILKKYDYPLYCGARTKFYNEGRRFSSIVPTVYHGKKGYSDEDRIPIVMLRRMVEEGKTAFI